MVALGGKPHMSPRSQEVKSARAGDRVALQHLLERNHGRFRALTRNLMGTRLRARVRVSDVLQSAYVEVIRGISGFREDSEDAFRAWMGRVLENGVRRKSRFFAAKKRAEPSDLDAVGCDGEAALGPAATPSNAAMQRENIALLRRALDQLRDDHRQVILMRVVEGKSHEEIARALGRPPHATRVLLSRARAQLSLALDRIC